MKATLDDMGRLRSAASAERRSSLYLWLYRNHDQFARVVADAGRPNWKKLSAAFGEMGLTDRLGHALTAQGTRLTWFKVRKAVAAKKRVPASAAPAKTAPLGAGVSPRPPILPATIDSSPIDEPDYDFGPVRKRTE